MRAESFARTSFYWLFFILLVSLTTLSEDESVDCSALVETPAANIVATNQGSEKNGLQIATEIKRNFQPPHKVLQECLEILNRNPEICLQQLSVRMIPYLDMGLLNGRQEEQRI